MKIKNGFIMSQVSGKCVALPTSGDMDMNKMIMLNETGGFLWTQLQTETDEASLVSALLAEYDVDETTARSCVQRFVAKLSENGFLE